MFTASVADLQPTSRNGAHSRPRRMGPYVRLRGSRARGSTPRASVRASRSRSRSAGISSARGSQPGDRIGTEQELATEFGVSRPTLREGLRLLASSHLIRVGRGRAGGIFVARTPGQGMSLNVSESISMMLATDTVSLGELLDARMFLEVPLAGLAAANATEETADALQAAIDEAAEPRAGNAGVQRGRPALPPDPRRRGGQRPAALLHGLDPRGAAAAADRGDRAAASTGARSCASTGTSSARCAGASRARAEQAMRAHLEYLKRIQGERLRRRRRVSRRRR